jgi:hypothetical protein
VFDSIIFERLGVPSVPIITKPFRPTADALYRTQGITGHQYVAVDHPITSLGPDELYQRARDAAPLVEAALLTGQTP